MQPARPRLDALGALAPFGLLDVLDCGDVGAGCDGHLDPQVD
jgi:hypothetical protein